MKTLIGGKPFRVKRCDTCENRFYYWSPKAMRWLPVAKAKVIFRDFSKVTEALLLEAAKVEDSDRALNVIQDAVGIDSGDVAGVFFSGIDLREDWPGIPLEKRLAMLREYVECETGYES